MAGFIYIMSNPAFPDLLKIGKSKKDPTQDRVAELNQTGVPKPFRVEYYAFVENEDSLESLAHQHFSAQRPNKKREFFNVECAVAINAIRDLAARHSTIKFEEVFYVSPDELKAEQERVTRKAENERARFEADKVERKRRKDIAAQVRQEHERQEAERVEADLKKATVPERLFLFFSLWLFLLFILAFLYQGLLDSGLPQGLETILGSAVVGIPSLICCALWWFSILGRR